MNLLLRWVIGAAALYLTVWADHALGIGGLSLAHSTNGAIGAFVVILVLTLVNATIRPVVRFVFAGMNCLTLGLFSFVINAAMFLLVGAIADTLHLGFHVGGFIPALFGSIVLSAISGLLGLLVPDGDKKRGRD